MPDASNQWIVHTQEVLTASETVLTTVIDADNAVRSDASSSDAGALEPLDRAERTTVADVNRLAALTADNPNQQARVSALREEMARALSALRLVADAKPASRVVSPAVLDAGQARMNALRGTMRAMRAEENLGRRRRECAHITVAASSPGSWTVTTVPPADGAGDGDPAAVRLDDALGRRQTPGPILEDSSLDCPGAVASHGSSWGPWA